MIDGEALNYSRSIIWECFPSNIEVLLDDSLFQQNGMFERQISPEIEQDRVYRDVVDKIWKQFDKDKNGELSKDETRSFLKVVLENCPPPHNYDENNFETTFTDIDSDGNGVIDKDEMVAFVKRLLFYGATSEISQASDPQ